MIAFSLTNGSHFPDFKLDFSCGFALHFRTGRGTAWTPQPVRCLLQSRVAVSLHVARGLWSASGPAAACPVGQPPSVVPTELCCRLSSSTVRLQLLTPRSCPAFAGSPLPGGLERYCCLCGGSHLVGACWATLGSAAVCSVSFTLA